MDGWYVVFALLGATLGWLVWRERRLSIHWWDIATGFLLVSVALGGVAALEAMMPHVERGTPEMDYQSQPFRGAAPLAHWTTHKQHRERDGCSTSGAFDQCYQIRGNKP